METKYQKKEEPQMSLTVCLMFFTFIGIFLAVISCGPSKEEMEAREKLKADSLTKIEHTLLKNVAEAIKESQKEMGLSIDDQTSNPEMIATEIEYKGHIYVFFESTDHFSAGRWGSHSATCSNPNHQK